jgi:hypothetical protein
MDFFAPIFIFTTFSIAPGDYVFPFSFALPPAIPSSIIYKNLGRREKPKGKVKYHIRVKLNTRIADLMGMSYKQILIIRERPPNFEAVI